MTLGNDQEVHVMKVYAISTKSPVKSSFKIKSALTRMHKVQGMTGHYLSAQYLNGVSFREKDCKNEHSTMIKLFGMSDQELAAIIRAENNYDNARKIEQSGSDKEIKKLPSGLSIDEQFVSTLFGLKGRAKETTVTETSLNDVKFAQANSAMQYCYYHRCPIALYTATTLLFYAACNAKYKTTFSNSVLALVQNEWKDNFKDLMLLSDNTVKFLDAHNITLTFPGFFTTKKV